MSLTAVVTLTGFREDCSRAIRSLIPLKHYFKDLVIVHRGYVDDERSMYSGWVEDRESLSPVTIKIVAQLDAVHVDGQATVEINPFCDIRQGAMDELVATLKGANQYQTRMGMTTSLVLDNFSVFYGFIMVSYVIDWFWQRVWCRGKLYQNLDVQSRRVVQVGPDRYLPSTSVWHSFIWNNVTIPRMYGGNAAITRPSFENGFQTTLWYFYNHSHYTWSWWIMPFSIVWMTIAMAAYGLLLGNIGSMWILSVWSWEIVLAYLICESYIKCDWASAYYPLFPIYWILFPVVIIYSKITTPQRSWSE